MCRGGILSAILALFSTFTVALCMWSPKNAQVQPTCTSSACAARGQEYVANMLRTADPCQDFYSFACGSWEKNHPTPPHTEWDVAKQMDENTLATLRKLLEGMQPYTAQRDPELARLKWTYDACMNIPYYGKFDSKAIAAQITRIDRYPKKKLWDLHNEYLSLTGESSLFDTDVGHFNPNIDMPMLQFSIPVSAYGSILHESGWLPADEKNYADALYEMLSSLGLSDLPDVLRHRIRNALQFRRDLNSIMAEAYQQGPQEPKHTSPRDFDKLFRRRASFDYGSSYRIEMPWEKISKILIKDAVGRPAMKKDIVVLQNPDYFENLATLLARSTEQQIADHMEIHFIERHLKRTEKVKQLLKKSWQNPPDNVRALRLDEPRWKSCIKESNLESTLAKLYVRKWLKPEHKEQVAIIMTGLKSAINTQMTKSTWLDSSSQLLTTKRLNEIEGVVGELPKRLERYAAGKTIYPTALLDVENDILFVHAAMLQSPIFDAALPNMYNIATTGFLLGHEYHHVIDDCGVYKTSLHQTLNLWPEKMQKSCQERKQCFITEYNKFTLTEFQRRYKLTPKVDTTKSFIENYPDVMGLEAALRLHEKLKEKNGGKCEILPGFTGYSCDQMFFIAFANTMCGMPPAKQALTDLTDDEHSINPVRVNGALSSTKAFARAFQCSNEAPMNPSKKCNLWK